MKLRGIPRYSRRSHTVQSIRNIRCLLCMLSIDCVAQKPSEFRLPPFVLLQGGGERERDATTCLRRDSLPGGKLELIKLSWNEASVNGPTYIYRPARHSYVQYYPISELDLIYTTFRYMTLLLSSCDWFLLSQLHEAEFSLKSQYSLNWSRNSPPFMESEVLLSFKSRSCELWTCVVLW
jgi:hypothetical protein